MLLARRAVAPLRVLLVVAFVALVVAQVHTLPDQLARLAEANPDLAYLRAPVLVVSVLHVVCLQVVVVCTWRLLTMVEQDRIFTEASSRWLDAIVAAVVVAELLLLGEVAHLLLAFGLTGLSFLLGLMAVAGAVLALLLLVVRALLLQATALRTDLDGVI
ncbi:DUF2975 domain-containing protein [Aquipuribacter sp. SD81]|uniref:DUF2975 domain-containing protein n=1 Tax=Aquipuribacter sp. SD81 TaxID=3127703 RepID=UPI003016F45F